MSEAPPDWPRPLHRPGGGAPYVAFAVLGAFRGRELAVSRSRHRVAGIPEGVEATIHPAEIVREVFETPLIRRIHEGRPAFADALAADDVMLVRGAPAEAGTLNYLRDTVGIVTAALEIAGPGAVAVDLAAFTLRDAGEWRREAFEPPEGDPQAFASIFAHPGEEREMLTTRGMRNFGRPDLAFLNVEASWRDKALEAMKRLIAAQARGHVVREGAPLAMEGGPEGFVLRHAGGPEDDMFNNAHIRIDRAPSEESSGDSSGDFSGA